MSARTIGMVTAAVLFASMAGFGTLLPPLQAQTASAGNPEATTSPSSRTAKEEPTGSIGVVFETPTTASSLSKLAVKSVVEDGPAANAGIKSGDEIQSLDGSPVASLGQFTDVLSKHPVGSSVKVEYLRAGQHLQCVVVVVERKQLYRNWYAKLAQRGDPEGEYNFGMTYYLGSYGTPKDYKSAFLWFSKAADQGVANALLALGYMYAEGQGVTKDIQQALKWWQKAAEKGQPDAEDNLGMAYFRGEELPKDYKQAAQWFTKAAEQGNAPAQYNLASLYYEGHGVERDYTVAMQWFQKSAERGYAPAQLGVGAMYENGRAGTTNFGEAMAWYQKAAQQGFGPAQLFIGNLYAQGRGVQKDLQQARLWYAKAVQAGDSDAKAALTRLDAAESSAKAVAEERVPPQQFAAMMQKAAESRAKADFPEDLRTQGLALGDALRLYLKFLKNAPRFTGRDDGASTLLTRIQDLSAKLGKDLIPKNADDVRSMLAVFHDCQEFALRTESARGVVQEIRDKVFARTHSNIDVLESGIQNYFLPKHDRDVAAIDIAVRTMQETERSLDGSDYLTAANDFASLSSLSFLGSVQKVKLWFGDLSPAEFGKLMPVVDEYVQQSSRLKEDLQAYVEANQLNRGANITLIQVTNNVVREQELLRSAQPKPLTKAFLEKVIAADSAELKQRINSLPLFEVKEAGYALPPKFVTTEPANAQGKAEFLKAKLTELDSKLASFVDIKAIYTQPTLSGLVAQQCGNETMSVLNARRAEINHAEAIRASLADNLNSVQAKIQQYDAEVRARETAAKQAQERREAEKQAAIEAPRLRLASAITQIYRQRLRDNGADPRTVFNAYPKTLNATTALVIETDAIVLPANAQEFLQNSSWIAQAFTVGFKGVRLTNGRITCDFGFVSATTIRPGICFAQYWIGSNFQQDIVREWPKGYVFNVQ